MTSTGTSYINYSFTIYKKFEEEYIDDIIKDIEGFGRNTNEINFSRSEQYKESYGIMYRNWRGLSWTIGSPYRYGSKTFQKVYAHISPKVFTGIRGHVATADTDYLKALEDNFNRESARVSKLLEDFSSYKLNREKYYIDFDLEKMGIPYPAKMVSALMNRGDLPFFYEDFMSRNRDFSHKPIKRYIEPSDRERKLIEYATQMYNRNIIRPPVRDEYVMVNVLDRSRRRGYGRPVTVISDNSVYGIPNESDGSTSEHHGPIKGHSSNPADRNLQHIVRFEVLYKYNIGAQMSELLNGSESSAKIVNRMFSDDAYKDIVTAYYNGTIMPGDYYSLSKAAKKIKGMGFDERKTTRLIRTLELIEQKGGVNGTDFYFIKDDGVGFVETLRELCGLWINPVVMPDGWGVEWMPGLLDVYSHGLRGADI